MVFEVIHKPSKPKEDGRSDQDKKQPQAKSKNQILYAIHNLIEFQPNKNGTQDSYKTDSKPSALQSSANKYSKSILDKLRAKPSSPSLSIFIKRHGACWFGALEQRLQLSDGFRAQQHIAAHIADFCRHMVNYDDATILPHGVSDCAQFVFARTFFDAAFHINLFVVSASATLAALVHTR